MANAPIRPTPPPGTSNRNTGAANNRDADHRDEKLPAVNHEEGLLKLLHGVIHIAVRLLAVLMTLVIVWGVADVVYVLYQQLLEPPFMLLTVSDILLVFGSFMAVLIAIEIFVNITVYIKRDALPIKMVIATALMAVARKVIMLDFKNLEWPYLIGIAAVILALGLTYWLISYKPQPTKQDER